MCQGEGASPRQRERLERGLFDLRLGMGFQWELRCSLCGLQAILSCRGREIELREWSAGTMLLEYLLLSADWDDLTFWEPRKGNGRLDEVG